jgi:hypothetical protein
MKKSTVLILALFSFVLANAQKGFYGGGILAVGQSSFAPSSLENQNNKLFLGGGIRGMYHFNKYFGLEADGILTSKGTKATGTSSGSVIGGNENFEESYDFIYVEVPFLAKIRVGRGDFFFKAFAGPSLNFNVDSRYSINYENSNNNDITNAKVNGIKVMETAFVYGAGIEVNDDGTGLYSLSVRFSNGITDIGQTTRNNNSITNQYFAICLGWTTN